MALLTLKDIGKIYVSEGSVAVGIRGVNLSFDRGEFVAITGKSGSGKSTLLNVISGMDSYEEGELYIEGQTTSHYLQPEWEEYREKYISFIFQDYNIIESFTVLQNVELALMHIEDKKERRRRALELLDRVGLSSHVKQKGSKLSGGQKQRTVIARALAKDSPIILADEPTGNLDSATSAEIIELLREVSRDKLLIVVTHNFEQVEHAATRHVRIFDGAVESDHVLVAPQKRAATKATASTAKHGFAQRGISGLKKGLTLGRSIFTAKPKLSIFLCLLMIIGTLGVFMVTTLLGGGIGELFAKNYMFDPIDGRVVLTKQNGEVLSEEEVSSLIRNYGAVDHLRFDALLDQKYSSAAMSYYPPVSSQEPFAGGKKSYIYPRFTYGEHYGDDVIGSYPTADNEVFLYLPISCQPQFGDGDTPLVKTVLWNDVTFFVTGVKYYYDNNLLPRCLFTQRGFESVTALHYLKQQSDIQIRLTATVDGKTYTTEQWSFTPSYEMEEGTIYVSPYVYEDFGLKDYDPSELQVTLDLVTVYYDYNYDYYDSQTKITFEKSFDSGCFTDKAPIIRTSNDTIMTPSIAISHTLLRELANEVLSKSYCQMSLFFENNEAAHAAAERLNADGYIAVPADTTYVPEAMETFASMLLGVFYAILWLLAIIFLAFFINLCSSRALGAFKSDMAIMRSMGIPVKVIRIGMYVRMLIALIPAYVLVIATAFLIFTTPSFNKFFVYLYAWQYVAIFVGMLLLTLRITHKQIRKLFGESVKKSLKGGAAE